jgi:hypothetical protein
MCTLLIHQIKIKQTNQTEFLSLQEPRRKKESQVGITTLASPSSDTVHLQPRTLCTQVLTTLLSLEPSQTEVVISLVLEFSQ